MSDVNEQLDRIREVIEEIETKGYSELQIGGKRFKSIDLPVLYAREQTLMQRVNEEANGFQSDAYVTWGGR